MNEREERSRAEGGRGQVSRFTTRLAQLDTPITVGRSPGSGVNCTVTLQMNGDSAYDGAIVQFYAEQSGKFALFDTQTITTAEVNNDPTLALSSGTLAADSWEVYLTLTHGTLPVSRLNSSVAAFGVEMATPASTGTYTGTFPIVVTGTVISIDPSAIPWVQIGGVGGVIEAVDATASVQANGGTASAGFLATAFGTGIASGLYSLAAAQGQASGNYSLAVDGFAVGNNSIALGDDATANGDTSLAGAGGFSDGINSVSFHETSSSTGNSDTTFSGGQSLGPNGFAVAGTTGLSGGPYDVAFGSGSSADGGWAFAIGGGIAGAFKSFAHGQGTATAQGAAAFNQMVARENWAFAAGVPGQCSIEIGNDVTNTAIVLTASLFSIFGGASVPQQPGGAATAGPVYTATEQAMLNTMYTALLAYGWLAP